MAWNVSGTVGADDPLCEAGFCVWEDDGVVGSGD